MRLIDFGLARVSDPALGLKEPYRGGVAFFYEPEYAAAARAGKPPPPASEAGEQYGLAVLLYHLLTGLHYLDFSLEQDEMLRQIAEDPPLPFVRQGLDAWPAMEGVLARPEQGPKGSLRGRSGLSGRDQGGRGLARSRYIGG